MMWHGKWCIMYEIFFVNFWIEHFKNSKKLKTLILFQKPVWFAADPETWQKVSVRHTVPSPH